MSDMVITIAGLVATGTSSLLEELRKHLRLYSFHSCGAMMRETIRGMGFENLEEGLATLAEAEEDIDLLIDMKVGDLARECKSLVVEGRLAHWAVKKHGGKNPDLSVLLVCDSEERARRNAERKGISMEQSRLDITKRDEEDFERFRTKYDLPPYKPDQFHLVLNSGIYDTKTLAIIIFDMVRRTFEVDHAKKTLIPAEGEPVAVA